MTHRTMGTEFPEDQVVFPEEADDARALEPCQECMRLAMKVGNAQSGSSGAGTLYLASRSPRRRKLLAEAGIEARVLNSGVDDGLLRPGRVSIEEWTIALAYFKARAGALRLTARREEGVVLGADTLVEHGGDIVGQPADVAHAREILHRLSGDEHHVISGVALVDPASGERSFLCDTARVVVGRISDDEIERYLASGWWNGKAGAYNLEDRIEAGWPIRFDGDAGTIMGLPMQRLVPHLARRWGITARGDRNDAAGHGRLQPSST